MCHSTCTCTCTVSAHACSFGMEQVLPLNFHVMCYHHSCPHTPHTAYRIAWTRVTLQSSMLHCSTTCSRPTLIFPSTWPSSTRGRTSSFSFSSSSTHRWVIQPTVHHVSVCNTCVALWCTLVNGYGAQPIPGTCILQAQLYSLLLKISAVGTPEITCPE